MNNLILAFNVVLPLFLCIALGYFLRRIGMMEEAPRRAMNKLCFKVFLPFYLFHSICTTDLGEAFDLKLILIAALGIVGLFALAMLIVPRIEKEPPRRGVMIQGIFRSNYALFGLPVALSLCGESKMGPTSLLLGVIVPIFNVLAVITLETFRGGKPDLKKMLKGILTNPLIISSLGGVLVNLSGVQLPSAVLKGISDVGRVATPLSLVVLGSEFMFSNVRGYLKQLLITVTGRLVFCPLIMVVIAAALGLRNEMLIPVMILFGAPTAVSSFTMAQQMDGDSDLAASIVVFTSAFAILSIFLWIFILKQLALI
ncbi:MAG: AEC family transporter [Clostridia bacterium]|nr:AEC family transporter [Clostridia bacterium]